MVVSCSTQLAAQDTLALKQVWETIQPNSCPHTYNFHLHTVCSDGQLTPEGLAEQALAIGLKGLAITDHHSIHGFRAAQSYLQNTRLERPQTPIPHLWTGMEVTSRLLGTEVHLLGYGFDPEHPKIQGYLQGDRPQGSDALAANAIDALHQAGGLVVLAHPARYQRPADQLIPAAVDLGIDGVETYYAYGNPKPWATSSLQSQQVRQLAQKHGLFITCGTDTHGLNILHRI